MPLLLAGIEWGETAAPPGVYNATAAFPLRPGHPICDSRCLAIIDWYNWKSSDDHSYFEESHLTNYIQLLGQHGVLRSVDSYTDGSYGGSV